jgi:hypothetical protein
VAFFKPLSSYYTLEIETWLRASPGRWITQAKLTMLFGYAYGIAATVATAISAFRFTGIWSVNRDVFEDHHFTPSLVNTLVADFVQPTRTEQEDGGGTGQECSQNAGRCEDIPSSPSSPSSPNLLVPVDKISPLPNAAAIVNTNKKQGVSQKATEQTLSPYNLTL